MPTHGVGSWVGNGTGGADAGQAFNVEVAAALLHSQSQTNTGTDSTMRLITCLLMSLGLAVPATAGLLDDLKVAVGGHIADFQSRSQPDQVLADAETIATATLRTDDPGQDRLHSGEGQISLVRKDGMVYLQLHNDVKIGFAPDLYLYLSAETNINDEARFNATEQLEVAKLVKGEGASFYSLGEINAETLKSVKSVTVWCRQFNEFMASGDFGEMQF